MYVCDQIVHRLAKNADPDEIDRIAMNARLDQDDFVKLLSTVHECVMKLASMIKPGRGYSMLLE